MVSILNVLNTPAVLSPDSSKSFRVSNPCSTTASIPVTASLLHTNTSIVVASTGTIMSVPSAYNHSVNTATVN